MGFYNTMRMYEDQKFKWGGIRTCYNCKRMYCPTCAPYDKENEQFLCAGEEGKEFCSRIQKQNAQRDSNYRWIEAKTSDGRVFFYQYQKWIKDPDLTKNPKTDKIDAETLEIAIRNNVASFTNPQEHAKYSKFRSKEMDKVSSKTRGRTQRGGMEAISERLTGKPGGYIDPANREVGDNVKAHLSDLKNVRDGLATQEGSSWFSAGLNTIQPADDEPRTADSGTRRRTAAEILASRRPRTPPVLARLLEEIREANRRANRKSANQA